MRARGTMIGGQVFFQDEEPIGSLMHGPFMLSEFSTRLGSAGAEFRYALLREALKVGIYFDQVVYATRKTSTRASTIGFSEGVGLSGHVLIADEFQCRAYFGIGLKAGGVIEFAPMISFEQVF